MNLKEVREYTESLIKSYFKPKVLKKFDEDTNGNLTYDGDSIGGSVVVSTKPDNALEKIDDITNTADNGYYVKDLEQTFINRINIAQKTINELGYDELLDSIIKLPATNNATTLGDAVKTTLNVDIKLLKSVNDYEYIDIYLKPSNEGGRGMASQCTRIKVKDIVFNNTNTASLADGSQIICSYSIATDGAVIGGASHFPFTGWFKNDKTFHIDTMWNPLVANVWSKFQIQSIQGIKKEVITIDPINYLDTAKGIQEVPVGHLVTMLGSNAPEHYLKCDGTEYNIVDYKELAEHIKNEFGKYNYFGGDGEHTFAVPNYKSNNTNWTPLMTSNSAPTPYKATASSIHSDPYQPFKAFNGNTNSEYDAWHTANGITAATNNWLQIDLGEPKAIKGIQLKPRNLTNTSMAMDQIPKSFILQGSNDGVTYTDIKTVSGLTNSDYTYGKYKNFILDKVAVYRYYKLNNMVSTTVAALCIGDMRFILPDEITCIKYEPTYFIGSINGYEEIRNLTNGFIDLTLGTLNYRTTLLESIENFDKVEATIEGTWKNTGTKLGLKTHYFNVADIKERYISDGNWKNGNQLNYIDTIIDRNFNYITAIFMNDKTVNLSCYGDTNNISALHIRLRGIVNHYKVKSTN